ncbi:GTPase Obg [uncultured Desulfobacterium sp.]|uniref:GTPase Obg n=1 Tax=uncultured Desulfobacterium sp. TaxID=201089 RepID=A0A445N1G4_9BACT|nr:GTPase Obg [uncultured Desulfobacterium sp.]
MGFLDEAEITVVSGAGGNGCVSFRREKFIPKGGPDGGDGGNGGAIIVRATGRIQSLSEFSSKKLLKARNGAPGRGKNQSGKNGSDLILDLPLGTIIQDLDTGRLLADLIHDGEEVLLFPGGRGGKGNQHFATSTNRVPRFAQPGNPGQEKRLKLSLKFLADIGLVGLPNSGKSTLLSCLSMARPKVGGYPFTTLIPNLGVMNLDDRSVVIADIPGLIRGAGKGKGLGHRFLRHIERTWLLLHVLDITYRPDNDLLEDYKILRDEMEAYNPALIKKPELVVINKMDQYGPGLRDVKKLQKELHKIGITSLTISAITGEGLEKLRQTISVSISLQPSK